MRRRNSCISLTWEVVGVKEEMLSLTTRILPKAGLFIKVTVSLPSPTPTYFSCSEPYMLSSKLLILGGIMVINCPSFLTTTEILASCTVIVTPRPHGCLLLCLPATRLGSALPGNGTRLAVLSSARQLSLCISCSHLNVIFTDNN